MEQTNITVGKQPAELVRNLTDLKTGHGRHRMGHAQGMIGKDVMIREMASAHLICAMAFGLWNTPACTTPTRRLQTTTDTGEEG